MAACTVTASSSAEGVSAPRIPFIIPRGTKRISPVNCAVAAAGCSERICSPRVTFIVTGGAKGICSVSCAIAAPTSTKRISAAGDLRKRGGAEKHD